MYVRMLGHMTLLKKLLDMHVCKYECEHSHRSTYVQVQTQTHTYKKHGEHAYVRSTVWMHVYILRKCAWNRIENSYTMPPFQKQ